MPQIWTRWLQVKRIRSGTPDHNPIPDTAHKTPLLEHQPNLFNSTLIRCYCRQLDFYTGEDNHMGCECPAMDSSPGKNVQFTYRLQACSESVKRAGYYRELTVPGIRPFLLYSRPNIGLFAYHFQVVLLIGGNTGTQTITPRWPCRCLACWKNANLSGVPPGCSAYRSSAVSPDMVPLFRLSCPKA